MISVVMAMMMAGTAVPVHVPLLVTPVVTGEVARIGSGTCDEIMISRVRTGSISIIFVPGITITAINSNDHYEDNCSCE